MIEREDFNRTPFDTGRQLRQIAARQKYVAQGSFEAALSLESAGTAPDLDADEVLRRVEATFASMPAAEVADPGAFRYAMDAVLRYGDTALGKLTRAQTMLTADEGYALEAIIHVDGSRPSFLLSGGKPPEDHPFMGIWEGEIDKLRDDLAPVAAAVGRIQPGGGHATRYVGSGFLLSSDPPLILTNYHVLDDARRDYFIDMEARGNSLVINGPMEIDFAGEASSLDTNRFSCVRAWLPNGYGRGYAGIDAAVVQIEPLDGGTLPSPIAASAATHYAGGGGASLCTIGFPAPPRQTGGTSDGVDWSFVVTTLFGGLSKFGFKRLAPGRFWRPLGFRGEDISRRAFGHDATTFGGASGSPVLAWNDPGLPSFGLHFGGLTIDSNDALAFARVAADLRGGGISFSA
jgi:hypothetical protein